MSEQAAQPRKPMIQIPKWLWDQEKRPDHSAEGFEAAFRAAVEFCAAYEYHSIDGMQDDLFAVMSERLRHSDIEIEFVAVHYMTGRPRMAVRAGRHHAREDLAVRINPKSTPGKGKSN